MALKLFRRKPVAEGLAQAELEIHEYAAQPIFRWTNMNMPHTGVLTWQFVNDGGTISDLEAQTTAPVQIDWHPKSSLPSHAEGWVRFSPIGDGGIQFPIRFTLEFRTPLEVGRQVFRFATKEGSPERLE